MIFDFFNFPNANLHNCESIIQHFQAKIINSSNKPRFHKKKFKIKCNSLNKDFKKLLYIYGHVLHFLKK